MNISANIQKSIQTHITKNIPKNIPKNITKNIPRVNVKYIWVYLLVIVLLVIGIMFHRQIEINSVFLLYDAYALYGSYWKTTPEYCSPIVDGFTPILPLSHYAEFNKAIFPRIPSGENTINREMVIDICERNLQWLKQNAKICREPKTLEVLHVDSPDFKTKVMAYLHKDHPFIMRGVNLKCFETMRLDKLIEKVGNDKVYMSVSGEKTCPENIFTELKNIMENKCYITNSSNLFYRYDDLLPDSDMEIIKGHIDGYMKNDSKQLFLGITKGSGTPLHAAYTNNFFIMIQGEKKWSFFNPNQLALLYPQFKKKGIYMASETRFQNIDMDYDRLLRDFPMILYADRYEADIKERDILYNPRSWFHSVHNKTEISIACSTRWSNIRTSIPDRHMLRYGNMTNPELRDYVKEIYVNTGVLGIVQIDEHKHMIGESDPDAIPFWDKYTNDSHLLCKDENCSENWHRNAIIHIAKGRRSEE
jgi:hypothetical protein